MSATRAGDPPAAAPRILFASWNFPPRRGGIEELVAQLRRHLVAAGAEVTLLTGRAGGGSGEDPPGVLRAPLPGLAGYLLWLGWRLVRALAAGTPPRLLSSGALVGSFVELFARVRGGPHAVLVYGTDLTYPARLYQRWLRFALASVPRFLAISAAVEAELARRGLGGPARVRRLPPGVDPGLAEAPFDPEVAGPGRPVLLFVGRVVERKGLEPFVRACLPGIVARHDAELWVVGGEPLDSLAHRPGRLARLRAEVAAGPLAGRVRFFGAVPDPTLRAIYRRATLLVLPAIEVPGDVEGFGIVFLEAALFGVPAVSTRLGGIPDAVADGESGVLVEAGDWPAFGAAVGDLLDDDARRLELARRARERALRDYDWRAIAARCLGFLTTTRRD